LVLNNPTLPENTDGYETQLHHIPGHDRLIWRNRWETRRQAEEAIFQYINGFYNPRRRHSSLGGKSPLAFERKAA